MNKGTFYGISVGPGDPELLTIKAARILGQCRHVFVPRSRDKADSLALEIARSHVHPEAKVYEITFPMTRDAALLRESWRAAAQQVRDVLAGGADCCFLSLGDCLLFSTYVYLLRHLREIYPQARTVTIPGVTSFSAVASITQVPLGEGKQVLTIVPVADDLETVRSALANGGPVVLMKVGRHLDSILTELEVHGRLEHSVFVSHATQPDEHVEVDLRRLRGKPERLGYLSTIIVQAAGTVSPEAPAAAAAITPVNRKGTP